MKKTTCTFLVGLASLAFTHTAAAGLVVVGTINDPGFGFGNQPRDLTFQEPGGGDDRQSGCVGISGGALVVGPAGCLPGDVGIVHMGNGLANVGGDEASPPDDNQKFGAPTIADANVTNASEILIGFDAVEPGAAMTNGITVEDLTLKFYNGDNLVLAIDGSQIFLQTFPGVGNADYFFGIDEQQQEEVNDRIFSAEDFGNYRMALEATISGAQAGPESFFIVRREGNGNGEPIPEPASLGLLGLGIAGLGLARRRR